MADIIDRAKKVLFPDGSASPIIAKAEPVKRRARAKKTQPCSLVSMTADAAACSSNTLEKENRAPSKLPETKTTETGRAQKRGFRSRIGERSSLESTKSIITTTTHGRANKIDSLAAMGEKLDQPLKLPERESNTTSLVSSMNGTKGRRRRGRCNHPVSSLVQAGNKAPSNHNTSTNASSHHVGRKAAVSSLMNLSSSTQKPRPKATAQTNTEVDLIRNVQSLNLNETSQFSSPMVPKHRPFAAAGECTSPPGVLHRLSSISHNFFSPSKTPGSAKPRKKRLDKKRTPISKKECEMTDVSSERQCSPIITELAIAPRVKSKESGSKHLDVEAAVELNDCATSFDCDNETFDEMVISPSINPRLLLIASPLECADINPSSGVGDEEFVCAKANLFPAPNESTARFEESVRDFSVVSEKTETPRVLKPTSIMEASAENELKNGTIRGAAVLSIRKADPLPKADALSTECGDVEKLQGTEKKKGQKKKKPVPTSQRDKPHETKEPEQTKAAAVEEGRRKSARESKKTDRFTVDSWNKSGGRKVRFTNEDALEASSCDESDIEEVPKQSKAAAAEEGKRRSARESKKTDRFTVDQWNKSTNKKVELKNGDALEVTSYDKSDSDSDSEPLNQLLAGYKKLLKPKAMSESTKSSQAPQNNSAQANSNATSTTLADQWSNKELSILRNAQNSIDPTSSSYWEEIAALIEGKSASECREKWFSLVATPRGRMPKDKNKQPASTANTKAELPRPAIHDASFDDEDDLFQSTPMREALLDVQNNQLSKNLNQCSFFGSVGLSPFIQATTNKQEPGTTSLNDRRTGYKTYIDKLRKDLKPPSQNNSTKVAQHNTLNSCTIASLDSGDWGKIMSDGSVKLTIHEESEEELDDFFDDEEDFND